MAGKDIVNDFLEPVKEGNEHIIDIARKITDGKEDVTFSMQKRVLQPEQPQPPIREESPARHHTLFNIEGFLNYLKEYKTDNTVVLADVSKCQMFAVLDEKAPKGFETIMFAPQVHPLFTPWENNIIGCTVAIEKFTQFLIANRKAIKSPDAGELKMLFSQVRASTAITLHKGIGQNSLNGLTCQIEITGKKETEEVALPELITIDVPLFVDTEEREVEIDLILSAVNNEIFVMCSSSDVSVARIAAFEEMLNAVKDVDGVLVGFGRPNYLTWDYLR